MAAAHPLSDLVLARLVRRGPALTVDDAALIEIASAYGTALGGDDAGPATEALLHVAMFLDVEQKAPELARTILTLTFAAEPALKALGDAKSQAAVAKLDATKARFGDFQGDERVTKVLDSGARPAGTIAASPLARFQMQVPPKK